jgi:hypothetical protein
MAVHVPPTGAREGSDSNPRAGLPSVGGGGRVVLSLHARVSDHASGPCCSSLTMGI